MLSSLRDLNEISSNFQANFPGFALEISKVGSWDPTAFGEWGPDWKIGILKQC